MTDLGDRTRPVGQATHAPASEKARLDELVHLRAEFARFMLEYQFGTVAMDFWARLEHEIHYKYDGGVPVAVREGLENSARTAVELDALMEDLHRQVHGDGPAEPRRADPGVPSDALLETLRLIRESRR